MSPDTTVLEDLLHRARRRRQLLLTLRGVAISIGVVAIVLLLTGWAAHRFRTNNAAIIVLRVGALLTVLATIYFALVHPLLKRISDARLRGWRNTGTASGPEHLRASFSAAADQHQR